MTPTNTGTRPDHKVTFAVFTYNQAPYVRDAVLSALSQNCAPLEIILSDDCSTDGTFAIMQEIVAAYSGPHHVILRQETENRGLIGHISAVLSITRGDYVVLAAGDDISAPDRVSALSEKFAETPLLIHSSFTQMDESGLPLQTRRPDGALISGNLKTIAGARALYLGATGCWHRDLWEKYGPIEYTAAYEDLVMGYRAALENRVAYVDQPLVRYRIGSGITTQRKMSLAKKIQICLATIAAFDQRLADTRRHFPDRHDLIVIIEKERLHVHAVVAWFADKSEFLTRYSWRPSVWVYFVNLAILVTRRRFFDG